MSLADQQWLTARAKVSVLQARGLRIKGKEGAHALLQVGAQRFSTVKAQQQRADPVWDGQEASFELTGFPENSADLRVQVLQRALVGPDKVLGHVDIDLGELYSDKTRDKIQWFKLLGKPGKPEKERGEIQLEIQFLKGSMSASMFDLSGPDKSRSKMGKLKDKLRGKKKEGLSDSASAIVPSVTQILTDSEGEEGEEPASPKKKKNKLKSLFAPKSGLRRDSSQSMSTLSSFPERDSAIASSTSSGLNAESPEGKKKFKFLTHRRTGSSDSKNSQSGFKHEAPPQVCINGSHVYREEEPENKGSTLSLTSSGHGSMEELRREREERERMEEERIRVEREEEERKRKEREAEEQRHKIEADKERMRLENEKEEQRRKTEEERQRKQREAEEQQRKIEEERQRKEREAEEQRKAEEQKERMRLEREKEEQERKRKEREAEEQRQKFAEEKERIRLERVKEEEQMRRIEEERQRKEREAKDQRMVEEQKERMKLEREKEEQERRRKEREAEEQRQKIEEERERIRLEREAEEKRRKIEEERQRKEREAEEQRRKVEEEKERMRLEREKEEQEKKRKEIEAEEQKRKIKEERQRKEREAEDQRRKIEEEENARQIAEAKERNRKEEENKKRQEAERLAEEKKAREEEERRRKRVAEEEEEKKQKRIREEEERKEKERIRLEEERKNLEREREVKEAEQDLNPVPKVRTGKVSTASKPQEETLYEAESSNNPFESSEPEESTNPFEEPPASVRSARVSAVKPSASPSRTVSQPSVVNTNPFFDDGDDSVDGSLENLDSIERSTERSAKKGRAPLPPQNKLEMPKSIANSRGVLLEETKPYSSSKDLSRRPAPQPPGGLKKTTEEPDKQSQCPATLDQGREPIEGPERPQSHGQERKPLVGPEKPQSSKVLPISKDELKAWCIQSIKLGKGQNSSPQKADLIHNQAPTHQSTTYSGHRDFHQDQSSKKPADGNPFTGDGPVPVPARHNKGPAPAKPSSQKTLSEDESSNVCSSPKSPSVELAPLENELSSKDTTAEPLQTIHFDNLPRHEKVGEHLNKIDEPECLQLSAPSSVSQDVLSQESCVSIPDGLPDLDSLSREALAGTEVAKKKSQAPLPPAKPKRVGDPGNQLPSVSASKSKVDLGYLPQSQRNKNFQDQDQPKVTTPTTTSSSTPLAAKSEMKKVGVSTSADSGLGSGSKSLPLARVVPTDVQSSAGDLKGAGGASASVIRPHAVKPLSAVADKQPDLRETSTSKAAGGTDNTQPKPEAAETVGKGPYSQLTRAELVSLVIRQQDQLTQRDRRVGELEQYIDSLLVRVMEEQPSILMSLSSQKKTV